ncbi:hypothetical protein [uncultured Sphingopyxis sp.]|nr:hypothetical protein [uncultured Sphingopyxis sp.]
MLAITHLDVLEPVALLFERLIAALCVALIMFYAATLPAKATDQLQHSPALMVPHEHGGLDSFTVDTVHESDNDHVDRHDNAPDDESQPRDHVAGGHHHHGDSGPNLLVPGTAGTAAVLLSSGLHGLRKDRQIAGLRPVGPERPPRSLSLMI